MREPWEDDKPLTVEELAAQRKRAQAMTDRQLAAQYQAALHMCQLDRGRPPRAVFVQQLVILWRELDRRRKAGGK